MKFRSLILAGVVALVGGALGGCCCNLFCKIPDCDPCKPTCNPCAPAPCAVPMGSPSPAAAPAPVYAPAPAYGPAPTAPAAGPGGAACGAGGKACGK